MNKTTSTVQKFYEQQAVIVSVLSKCFGGWSKAVQYKNYFGRDSIIAWAFTNLQECSVSFDLWTARFVKPSVGYGLYADGSVVRVSFSVLCMSDRELAVWVREESRLVKNKARQREAVIQAIEQARKR